MTQPEGIFHSSVYFVKPALMEITSVSVLEILTTLIFRLRHYFIKALTDYANVKVKK